MIVILNRYTKAEILRDDKAKTIQDAVETAVLAGADLAGADLAGAHLPWARLARANLSRADLSGANLAGANLAGANLSEASLALANLSGVNCLTAIADFLRLGGSRDAIIAIDNDNVSIGCMRHPLAWWREHYEATGKRNNYTAAQIAEYKLHIEYVAQWLDARTARIKEKSDA